MRELLFWMAAVLALFGASMAAVLMWFNLNLRSRRKELRDIDARIAKQRKWLADQGVLQDAYQKGYDKGISDTEVYARAYDGIVEERDELRKIVDEFKQMKRNE